MSKPSKSSQIPSTLSNQQKEDTSLHSTGVSFTVVKRNGSLVPFRRERIMHALESAFRDTKKVEQDLPLSEEVRFYIQEVEEKIVEDLIEMATQGTRLTVEGIQDLVEITLMKQNHHDVARDYIIYRDLHKALRDDSPQNVKVTRKDGSIVRFNPMKVSSALEDSFRRTNQIEGPSPELIIDAVNLLTQKVVAKAILLSKNQETIPLMTLQDEIEYQLMKEGYFSEAKDFILHRSSQGNQSSSSLLEKEPLDPNQQIFLTINEAGQKISITEGQILQKIKFSCRGIENLVSAEELLQDSVRNFYEEMKSSEIDQANIMAAKAKIEKEPAYSTVAARLLLDVLYREALGKEAASADLESAQKSYFLSYIQQGIALERLSADLQTFDLPKLAKALQTQRDDKFTYLGLQTLYDRYFLHDNERRLETPQIFWMRVAMGLALCEGEQKTKRAIEFYDLLSTFAFTSGTPTLFNAGTTHSQLSSCYLSTVSDDLSHIFKVISDDAQLSKWAGGIGNDWTSVRATGAKIKGTNGKSQGIIPFLKVANDTAVAVNQGGKRKGAMCAYLETWHLDVEDFLELRKNTGDERRRTHDMNTANWIPDLFMKRVLEGGSWTLFSPSDTPDLHDLYGSAFEERYCTYEKMTEEGKLKLYKKVEALQLWRKILSMLFETGHPWITFKDPSNIRSPQTHKGVIHCSNLCTEILLNTSPEETAVCNLGSINLPAHMTAKGLDEKKLAKTIRTAVRMLDNVVDINFYPTKEAKNANSQHRPIGLGIMGFQDALYMQGISYASHEAIAFSDTSMEMISYYAILASSELARERGTYASYKGSKWDQGLLPIDTIALLAKERGEHLLDMDTTSTMNWEAVRTSIRLYGMRNSNTMAIAPTATISNITGITQSIEPMYKHLFVKSNLSGEFTIPNTFLVEKLKTLGLWDAQMLDDLKYFDGSIAEIDRIPTDVKRLFLTAFEIDPEWLIECASRRQKWIDMGQSLNLYLFEPSGKKLHQMYLLAWKKGLKTTYYLRSSAATQIEKSTTDINKRGLQPRWMKSKSASGNIQVQRDVPSQGTSCNLDGSCESCQ